jgi:hypothetical protein
VPTGYTLNGESYTNAETIASTLVGGSITQAEVEAIDMRWYYQSEYQTTDGQNRFRSYIEEYGSERGARKGFDLLEDESLFARSGVSSVDKPGFDGVGEEPSEVTISTVEAASDASSGVSIDATFRVGRLLVGVAFDTITTTAPDEDLLAVLAERVAGRAQAVLDGDDVPGIDPTLSGHLLTFDGGLSVQDGYVNLGDTAGSAAPQEAIDAFESGYLRVVALDSAGNPDVPLPIVTVLLSTFSSEIGALTVMSNAESMTPAFADLKIERVDPIPGTSAIDAFSFANPFESGSPDSFRIMAVVGTSILTVDVEGAKTLEIAESAAMALLNQQLACIDTACGPAELPVEIAPPVG